MHRYAISVDIASSEINGLWSADKPIPLSTADTLSVEVTEAQHANISQKGMQFSGGGAIRFKWDGTDIIEQIDSRPRLKFIPAVVDLDVGDTVVVVQVWVLKADDTRETSFNGLRLLTINGSQLRLDFTNGIANFQVQTTRALSFVVVPQPGFQLWGGLSVTVAATDIR